MPRAPKPLPPQMAAAFDRLKAAFDGPVPPATGWPFVNPPSVQKLIDDARRAGAKPGAKPKVTTPLIGRLVAAVNEGESIRAAAKRLGISAKVAREVLSGAHSACRPDVLAAAGISLPLRTAPLRAKNPGGINSPHLAKGSVASPPIDAPEASASEIPISTSEAS